MTTSMTNPPAATTPSPRPTATAQAPAPPRVRRRPAVVGLGVVLVAAGGLTSAWLVSTTGATTPVVVAAAPVLRGQVLTAAQLTTADVAGLDPGGLTPASALSSLVGQTVVLDVPAGSPIPPAAVTDTPLPAVGEAIVGLLLPPGQLPTVDLLPGARVRIVGTPRAQEDVPRNLEQGTPAVLVSTSVDDVSGGTVVNVAVPAPQAAGLAALAATGRAALVLDADQAGR